MDVRRATHRTCAQLAAASLAIGSGCIEPVPFSTGDGTQIAIIVGEGGSRVRVAPLTGTTDVLVDVDPDSTIYLGTLEVPYRALVPYEDGLPEAVDLVPAATSGARPLPLVALLDAQRRALDGLPPGLVTTHLPPLSDNRCAASEGCADLVMTTQVGPIRACLRPCGALLAPEPPADVARPTAPDGATSRARDGCSVRVQVDTATAGLTLARCVAPPPLMPPTCGDGERVAIDGSCVSLTACIDGFPPGLDDSRTWFVDGDVAISGDGTRARPARALVVAQLPAAVHTIAARGALSLDELPPTVGTIVGPCPSALEVSGALSRAQPLALERLRFTGTLVVRGTTARLRAVDWAMPRPAGLRTEASAAVELEDVALRASTSTSPGAPLARFIDTRVSGARVSIRGPASDGAVVLFEGGTARLDELVTDGVELRAGAGAAVTVVGSRGWAPDARPLAHVDEAELTFQRAVISGRGSPLALFVAEDASLNLQDLAARTRGAVVSARASRIDATDLAATVTAGGLQAAIRVDGGALALTRLDLVLAGVSGVYAERTVLRANDLVIEQTRPEDRGVLIFAGTSSVTRAAIFGLGRYGALLYGGRQTWADVHVALTSTATPPRVEPADRQSTGLFLADDAEPLELDLRRVRIEGGFFGLHGPMPRGHATLRDLDVGPSTIRRRATQDIVEPCAFRFEVVALDAARLRARAHGEQGLLLTVPPGGSGSEPAVTIQDLVVEAPVSRIEAGLDRCLSPLGPGDVPAIAVSLGDRRTAAISRVAVIEAETSGLSSLTRPGAQLLLRDVQFDQVRCRMLEHRGDGRLHLSRMSARRRAWPRSPLTADDLVSVSERSQLEAEDLDGDVDVGAARTFVRLNGQGGITLRRWRARRVTTLLFHDFDLEVRDALGGFVTRTLEDGALDDAERVTSLRPLGCEDVAARPPFLRVRIPRSLRVFDGCP